MIALHISVDTGLLWNSWSLDPVALVGIPLVAFLYYRGLASLGNRRRFHSTWRPWSFYLGLLMLAGALLSPLDHLSDELFYAHMTQHMLIMMVGAPLILLGAPIIPVLRGIPRPIRRSAVIPVLQSLPVRFVLRTLSRPLVAWPVYVLVLWIWHLPVLFVGALEDELLHFVEHFTFAFAAYLFWWNIIDPHPLRPNLSYLARIPYIFITVGPTFALGAFLTFSSDPWFSPYAITAPLHGISALEDQQVGGTIMWIPGSFIIGTALILDLFLAARQEQRAQLAQERGEQN
jgi:putative membrane protein